MSVLSHLAPALLQTFLTILVGYVFGRFKLVPPDGVRAMGTFVTMLALPALLLRNMIMLDLQHVPMKFFCAVLLAKAMLFVFTVAICLARHGWRSRRGLSDAGCFGIFVTQSNDFAMGLPILTALFGSHPATASLPSLLYVIAPINLAIINPIAFFMMELGREPVPELAGADQEQLAGAKDSNTTEGTALARPTGSSSSSSSSSDGENETGGRNGVHGPLVSPTTAAADAEVALVNPRSLHGGLATDGASRSSSGLSHRPMSQMAAFMGNGGSGSGYHRLSMLDDGEASSGAMRSSSAAAASSAEPSVEAILNAPDSDSSDGGSDSGSDSGTEEQHDAFSSRPRRRKRSVGGAEELPLHMAPDGATFSFLSSPAPSSSLVAAAAGGRKRRGHGRSVRGQGRGSAPPALGARALSNDVPAGTFAASPSTLVGAASAAEGCTNDTIVVSLSVFPTAVVTGSINGGIGSINGCSSSGTTGFGSIDPSDLVPSADSSPLPSPSRGGLVARARSPFAGTAPEASSPSSSTSPSPPSAMRLLLVLFFRKVLGNPVVLCSLLGIAFNLALGGKVPEMLDGFLAALGNTFSALALFILGVNMQGKLALFADRRKLSVPLMLILAKSLALPVIVRLLTQALGIPASDPITVCAFLIGTFPTAPSAHFFAVDSDAYSKELIAPAMVLGTFVAAPIMFVSAQMATTAPSLDEVNTIVSVSTRAAAGFGFVAAVYCCIVFFYNKSWRNCDTRTRLLLTLCALQALYNGAIQTCSLDLESPHLAPVASLRYALVLASQFGVYVWTALMGANEVVRRFHGTRAERALFPYYNLVGLLVLLASVGGAALFGSHPTPLADIPFCACWNRYGKVQWGITVALLCSCFVATCAALVWSREDATLDPTAGPDTQPHIEIDLGGVGANARAVAPDADDDATSETRRVGNGRGEGNDDEASWGIRASLLANSPPPGGSAGLGSGGSPNGHISAAAIAEEGVSSSSSSSSSSGRAPRPGATVAAAAASVSCSSPSSSPSRLRMPCDAPEPSPPAPWMRASTPTPSSPPSTSSVQPATTSASLSSSPSTSFSFPSSAPPAASPVAPRPSATEQENFWLFAMRIYLLLMAASMFLTLALYAWSADNNGVRIEMQLLDAVLFASGACYSCALFAATKSLRSPLGPFKRCLRRRVKALSG